MKTLSAPNATTQPDSLHRHLEGLLAKYAVVASSEFRLRTDADEAEPGTTGLLPGWSLCDDQGNDLSGESARPLLPWRSERRFVELRNLVTGKTVEGPCLWRSRVLSAPGRWTLFQAIYREVGLCQWVLGEPFVSVYVAAHSHRAANLVGRLASGIACGIEIVLTLPETASLQDRHEIIARRGVASDQVVDAILRPHSLYVMTQDGLQAHRDTDTELFGLTEDQAALVREAFEAIRRPETAVGAEHRQICRVVAAAAQSVKSNQRQDVIP